jgi:hypothetical protein
MTEQGRANRTHQKVVEMWSTYRLVCHTNHTSPARYGLKAIFITAGSRQGDATVTRQSVTSSSISVTRAAIGERSERVSVTWANRG